MNLSENNEDMSEDDILAPRKVALDMLSSVLDRKTALDIVLDTHKEFAALEVKDRAFIRMLLTTTLRRLGQIDDLIMFAQDRPNDLKTPVVRNILRLGVTQIFFMVVPDYASVDSSVLLTEEAGMTRQKGFVNAILRTLIRKGGDRLKNQDEGRLNTPPWLLEIWIKDYGLNVAAKIAMANLNEAHLDISLKNQEQSSTWQEKLNATKLRTGTLRRNSGGNIREIEGFDEGEWWVQDASAALPATLFGDVKGEAVIDMCAAPGGKTLQLASMGAQVTAIDRSAKRLKRLEENLERMDLKDSVTIEVSDASICKPAGSVKHILLDAPCSATGTIRRHPDTGYLKSLKDVLGLVSIQERLLQHAGDIIEIGGKIIYCTCSLQKDEGEYQIDLFLKNNTNFIRSPIKAVEVGDYAYMLNENGDLRVLPYHLSEEGGMDGFFVSRLIRVS